MSDPESTDAVAGDAPGEATAPATVVVCAGDRLRVTGADGLDAYHVAAASGPLALAEIARACGVAPGAACRVALASGRVLDARA